MQVGEGAGERLCKREVAVSKEQEGPGRSRKRAGKREDTLLQERGEVMVEREDDRGRDSVKEGGCRPAE